MFDIQVKEIHFALAMHLMRRKTIVRNIETIATYNCSNCHNPCSGFASLLKRERKLRMRFARLADTIGVPASNQSQQHCCVASE